MIGVSYGRVQREHEPNTFEEKREVIKRKGVNQRALPEGIKHFSDHSVMLTGEVKNEDPGRIVGWVNRFQFANT